MTPPIRTLYLTSFSPTEGKYGAQIRTREIALTLQALGSLDCVVIKNDGQSTEATPAASINVTKVINLTPSPPRTWSERCQIRLDPKYIDYYGHSVGAKDRRWLADILPNYNLVWLHNLKTANAFSRWNWANSVLDLDDVPSTFYRSVWKRGERVGARLRAGLNIGIARRRERLLLQRFDRVAVCSEQDRRYLGFRERVDVIPNGFSSPETPISRTQTQPRRIGFIGTFDYQPNAQSVSWFINECWPKIRRQFPGVRLRLIGNKSDTFSAPDNQIDKLGWMADAEMEIATWSAMIVPVRYGAGTRIKVAEGFGRKCPIVSTSLGAFGYDVTNGRELLLADSAEDFANACLKILREPVQAEAMAERAWQQFQEKWSWEAVRPRIRSVAENCLRRGTGSLLKQL